MSAAGRPDSRQSRRQNWLTVAAFVGILLLATGLRFWNLENLPPGFYLDEAAYGNDAIQAMESGDRQVFYPDNFGREGLYINLVSYSFEWFGIGIAQQRAVNALAGVFTVLGLYFLTRELSSRRVALLATLLLASSFSHLVFSRIGFRASLTPLFIVWGFFFLLRAARNRRLLDYLVTGLLFGLGLYTYIAFRLGLVAAALFVLAVVSAQIRQSSRRSGHQLRHFWQTSRGWLATVAAGLLASVPLLIYFFNHPADFVSRAGPISIFAQDQLLFNGLLSLVATLGMFTIQGDPIWRHNIANEPLLLWPVGLCFLLGLGVVASRDLAPELSRPQRFLLFTWLGLLLLPTILTVENLPHSLRAIGVLPVVAIFAAFGARFAYQFARAALAGFFTARQWRVASIALVIVFAAYLVGSTWQWYFVEWANRPETALAHLQYHVDLAHEMAALPNETRKIIVVDLPGLLVDGFPIATQTLQFLLHETPNVYFVYPEGLASLQPTPADRVVSLFQLERDQELEHCFYLQ